MAQHDYNIANAGGAAVRSDINDALQAIITANSGATEPTVTRPYMLWNDTTAGALKIRNAADTAWVLFSTFATADVTTTTILNATAGASVGAVGTYAFAVRPGTTGNTTANALGPGATVAGSVLRYSNTANSQSSAPAGTWRCMGFMAAIYNDAQDTTVFYATLFLRIS